ncbi:NAD-binding protein [Streptomyces sp. NPDC059744]|uniref:NAD-binding protein n=1 Tax=Streptomyces sp. NPDC059744 TaxID=3346929 RepID=UPI0036618FD6
MVICGDDGLARRLAIELDAVCGEAVTVVLPSRRDAHGAEIAALHRDPHSPIELLVATHLDEQTLRAAGVQRAAALALTYADDQVNVTAALLARGLNPSVRLVIRMFNRERGRHLERFLDRAAAEAGAGSDDDPRPDMSTTVLSDADTAVPELVAAAAVGYGHTLQVEGKVFRGVVRAAGAPPRSTDPATLAVLSGAPGRPGERRQPRDTGRGRHPAAAGHPHRLPPAVHTRPGRRSIHQAFRSTSGGSWPSVRPWAQPTPSSTDTLTGIRLHRPGFDWRPSHGRVLRAGDRVVPATTRRGLDILMTGVQPHPTDRRG